MGVDQTGEEQGVLGLPKLPSIPPTTGQGAIHPPYCPRVLSECGKADRGDPRRMGRRRSQAPEGPAEQ